MILATRGSALAMAQAELVRRKLEAFGEQVTILPVTTRGDRDRNRALSEIGGDGLFIRELEKKLLSGEADLAVHCGKDLPFRLAEGLVIGGTPEMGDPRDCLLKLPDGENRIGTGSPRRILEYGKLEPEAEFAEIRGNINTRIGRLREGRYGGIILAKAGLDRLRPDLEGLSVRIFSTEEMIPSPCQGILAAECRADDRKTQELLKKISDPSAERRFTVERCLFQKMQADCATPVGIYAEFAGPDGEELHIRALLGGKYADKRGPASDYERLCEEICREICR